MATSALVLPAARARTYFLMPGDRERAGGLDDGARVLEDVLDRRADLVGVDEHDLVDVLAAQPEGLLADPPHRDAVGEDADALERHALAGAQRLVHRRRILRLDADDPDLADCRYFTYTRDAGDQAAAADRHEDRVERRRAICRRISTPIVPCPAITSGSSNGCTNARLRSRAMRQRVLVGAVVVVAVQHHLAAEVAHRAAP